MLNIITKLMSENDCYKAGRTITPRGITIHRAGARSACMHLQTTKSLGSIGPGQCAAGMRAARITTTI